ncbi:MAG: S41 family peptidase [Bacteroidota bacterium]
MKRFAKRLLLLLLIPASLLCWGFSDDFFQIARQLDLMAGVYREVNAVYVDDVNPGSLMKSGIDGMLKSLDPYTNYYPESEIEDYRMKHVSTEYGGIGASSIRNGDSVLIYEVTEGYPAQQAGLRAGDRLLEVNGRSISGLSPQEIDEMVKGQAGTAVRLLVERPGSSASIPLNITRGEIKSKNVPFYTMVDDSTGYIKLEKFLQDCYSETRNALVELQKNQGMTSLIFDLRGNGGGLLEESVNILNLFLQKDLPLVRQEGKTSGSNNTYKTRNEPIAEELRVVVLIDKSSASASEITAGNFQDLDRGVVVGQRSFGKGLVQQTRNLTYNAQMKLTVAKYYTASGRCVQTRVYRHRSDEDGSFYEIPDSLVKAFKTKNGRTVYDGSAVYPDVYVTLPDTATLTKSLIRNLLIFDFASLYRSKHDSIGDASSFRLSDEDYREFVSFLSGRTYTYATQSEKAFESLKEATLREKYFASTDRDLLALGTALRHDRAEDLRLFSSEIKQFLQQEIVSRYHFQRGRFEYMFKHDPVFQEGLAIAHDPSRYTSVLRGEGQYKVIGKPRR